MQDARCGEAEETVPVLAHWSAGVVGMSTNECRKIKWRAFRRRAQPSTVSPYQPAGEDQLLDRNRRYNCRNLYVFKGPEYNRVLRRVIALFLTSTFGAFCGHCACKQIRARRPHQTGTGMAVFGLIGCYICIGLFFWGFGCSHTERSSNADLASAPSTLHLIPVT